VAGDDPELDDPPGAGNHHQQHADHRGQQQRDAQREVLVRAEVADGNAVPVLQDEDQQQQQEQRERRGRDQTPPVDVRPLRSSTALDTWDSKPSGPSNSTPSVRALPSS
jgi:hypothetical protein